MPDRGVSKIYAHSLFVRVEHCPDMRGRCEGAGLLFGPTPSDTSRAGAAPRGCAAGTELSLLVHAKQGAEIVLQNLGNLGGGKNVATKLRRAISGRTTKTAGGARARQLRALVPGSFSRSSGFKR